ncbi:ABC transporter [Talaromyces proteolyticus]|uniref:ABC transporter n=1 Tax=Talaromyces proteolyticus TaxID=1131652 RepID=A0AAD4KKI1_9EURO|nr:ABC transporter [Talaromyces proteolyticus]KAH8694908.1 ABC transporter [Talaromyces proteolyticus]
MNIMPTAKDICGDSSFGPQVRTQNCRGGFDFTVLFEESVLSLVPAALLLVIAPFRLAHLYGQDVKLRPAALHTFKLLAISVFACLQLALLLLWCLSKNTIFPSVSITSAVLGLISAFVIALLSHLEHNKSIRPSFLTSLYILVTLVFDIARARTHWLLRQHDAVAATLAAIVALKLAILLLESVEKRSILISIYRNSSTESTSGLFNRALFCWLNPLLLKGFMSILSVDDLFPISENLSSIQVTEQIQAGWSKSDKRGKNAFAKTVVLSFKWPFLGTVVPRICVVALKLVQPFLIQESINYINNPIVLGSQNTGYGLIAAYGLVYLCIAVFTGWYQHLTFRLVTMIRGGLVGVIFRKMLELNISDVQESSALTLMSTDVERIAETWNFVNELWASLIQALIAVWLLERQLGVVCVYPVLISLAASLSSFWIARYIATRQKVWIEAIQKRVNLTAELLGSIKVVKMLGFSFKLSQIVQNMRVAELDLSKRYRRLSVTNTCLTNLPNIIIPVITFTAFAVSGHNGINVSQAFTSLSILSLITSPIANMIYAIPQLYSALGCFQRIQEYIQKEPRHDSRQLIMPFDRKQSYAQLEPSASTYNQMELQSLKRPAHESDTEASTTICKSMVAIRDGSFGWHKTGPATVQGIDLQLSGPSLTIVVGPVGCGKSTLLKSILGETFNLTGSLNILSLESAFCDQIPWIKSGTLRENIIGHLEFDDVWYKAIIYACALDTDFQQLPDGDQTTVGSKGMKLSGGQRQRLSIARASYARKQLAIFDDVLSGLDALTEEKVCNRLLGRHGLLRKSGTAVILATHSVNYLSLADHIVILNSDGRIAKQGTFEQLSTSGRYLDGLARHERTLGIKDNEGLPQVPTSTTSLRSSEPRSASRDAHRQEGDWSVYRFYGASMGWWRLAFYATSIVSSSTFSGLQTIWLSMWSQSNDEGSRLDYWLSIYGLFALCNALALIIACFYFMVIIVPRSSQHLHWSALKIAMSAPLSFFTRIDTGIIVNHFSQDMRLLDMTLPNAMISASFQLVNTIWSFILTSIAVWYMVIPIPFLVGLVYGIQKFYLRTSRQLRLLDLETKAPLYSHFIESLSGLATLRAFGWSEAAFEKNFQLLDISQKPFYLLLCVQRWLTLVLDIVVAIVAVLLISLAVALRSQINPGFLGVAMVNVMNLSTALTNLVNFWTLLETSLGAVRRIKDFTENTESENLAGEDQIPPPEWPVKGDLALIGISAAYNSNDTPVLSNITLSVTHGQRVAVCGRTGSGKSSLLLALLRMIDLTEGTIMIDGVDTSRIPRDFLRSKFVTLPQDYFSLAGTVRFNADPLGQASDEQIIAALEQVQLWKLIRTKGGLDVNMDGSLFSHGQIQLFSLARAMLQENPILILDEPTSSVDTDTEELIQRLLRERFNNHTIIMIAHRLKSVANYDKIAVLDGGKLAEFDSPDALLSRPSIFRSLYEAC